MTIHDPVNIPPSALETKRWFPERPGNDVVREIKEFISECGKPYLWRGHTHTKPKPGALIVYIGEFDLPSRFKSKQYWAPCPCCSPRYPKYRESGKIGWFPEEHVIRIIGPDCFRALNEQGHDEALEKFRAEERREKDIRYLVENLPIVPDLLAVTRAIIPVAESVDEFSKSLKQRLTDVLKIDLWRELREGKLRLRIRRDEVYRRADGTVNVREVEDIQDYAPVEGYRLLNPKAKRFAPQLRTLEAHLVSLLNHTNADQSERSDDERRAIAKLLGDCSRKLRTVVEDLSDARKFGMVIAASTIRRWSEQSGSPLRLYTERTGFDFYIGRHRDEKMRIALGSNFDDALPMIPRLAETSL
ncbi:hypothetical protein [Parvibaculum sp.]|uniref:hypothetical protein n=1 Tax=Parvibaculum sp. TaxID=2024848 RepID=UPI0026317394|nr:hypothetical protein [Parvibaculum sp.]MCW5726229.1 hypothetical protein [Parvibaculum sp.]